MSARKIYLILFVAFLPFNQIVGQSNFYEPIDESSISWSFDDLGKMWTFDNVPIDYFENKYGFKPTEEWLEDVQKSALQFGGGCSGAFVSADGLIMTNHHCARGRLSDIEEDGEDLLKNGFYAESLNEERRIGKLYVDQLLLIEDVTEEIKKFMAKGNNDDEKIKFRNEIKASLVKKYNEKTDLKCKIVTLYHGGKYSLYGYKRYDDIRLVMSPDFQIAATGWDWDNFTYPRYELDFMFLRAYDENGKPVKVENYFTWSKNGAIEDEPIFVVGRPGSTDRLYSVAQLEYMRDEIYPFTLIGYNSIYKAYYELYQKYPENERLLHKVMRWGNARKSYAGRLAGLKNEFILNKKRDFQNDLINQISSNPELKEQYGHVWESIHVVLNELKEYSVNNLVTRFNRIIKPVYYKLAEKIIKIANDKKLSEENRNKDYNDENILNTLNDFYPKEIDFELENKVLIASISFMSNVAGSNHPIVKNIFRNKLGSEAVDLLNSKSKLSTKESFIKLAQMSSEDILDSDDPFIQYALIIEEINKETKPKVKELNNTLAVLNQLLGEAVYSINGDRIPPDATATLRISDGVIKGYEYNGTIAPGKTTYYGLWDRYESFNKKTYPWGLHERWKTPPKKMNLSTAIGFASTNDIVGGNSGSSVININREVVGLVHDGNIESLAGHTIFLEENNRAVSTDSQGLIEALKYIYNSDRLVNELLNGEID